MLDQPAFNYYVAFFEELVYFCKLNNQNFDIQVQNHLRNLNNCPNIAKLDIKNNTIKIILINMLENTTEWLTIDHCEKYITSIVAQIIIIAQNQNINNFNFNKTFTFEEKDDIFKTYISLKNNTINYLKNNNYT